MSLVGEENVPGRVEVDAFLTGPKHHTIQLILVLPVEPFDLEGEA